MYIKINDLNIYYQKVGKGPDLVMLHGWSQDVSTWWGVTDLLKDEFRLWLIDLPGFGRSDRPEGGFTNRDYAQVIAKFINQQNLNKPILLGHSVGGRIGIKLAATDGEVIGKLILEDSAGIKPKQDYLKPVFYVLAKIAKSIIPNWLNLRERIRHLFYGALESDYLTAGQMSKTLENLLEEDLTSELKKIQNETLLIWGEEDLTRGASVADGRLMYQLIPNSRIELIEGVGHFPHLENPQMFVYWLKNFGR